MELNERQSREPSLFVTPDDKPMPHLRWRATKRDLLELLSIITKLELIADSDGQPLNLISILGVAEDIFSVQFSQPYKEKNALLNRKTDTVYLASRMQDALQSPRNGVQVFVFEMVANVTKRKSRT